jgi:Ca2+-binding RTX toxin-like protein
VGASRSPDGASGTVLDLVGDLDLVPSFEAAADGQDYIEGGGGSDILFGGLGQDDLVGGSSDFFSLAVADQRPDDDDLVFGGAGVRTDRSDQRLPGDGTAQSARHARDADAIAGDNARIVRIVGTDGTDGMEADPSRLYVEFRYDDYDADAKLVVRGVTLLDYTPGGRDFRPDLFAPVKPDLAGFREEFGFWTSVDIGGHDEVHGETGDDTVYLGGGEDVAYGDAEDDDLVGGWGHDWISGGTGQDGILGDDGRILTSRNTAGDVTQWSEPLSGVRFLLAEDPDPQHPRIIHGNVIDEFIFTPGQVQTATINVGGALKKQFDITPFNLTPDATGADEPLFIARHADDILYGGLGDDFLHGASGNDAIGGAEALVESYGQHYDPLTGALAGLVRMDWSRPYNPGDALAFGQDADPWNAPKPIQARLGEFALYDEYDPRRVVRLDDDGQKVSAGTGGHEFFLNFLSDEGTFFDGGVTPEGDAYGPAYSDGDDALFGDLGNDWIVGGTGRDNAYGGWGNDLLQADDVLGTTGDGSSDEAPDTHPIYEDRAYGGAGLDILIGNTGGDRLIDWVGEFNSYLVPFAPFGIATVSRQRAPQLDDFLYALSASDGADPTRAMETGNDVDRNGEPDGEIGLVNQSDRRLWQLQTGGPSDPQPGNIPSGPRDVRRSADFNDGAAHGFVPDSGTWSIESGRYSVAPMTLGEDAVSVWYADVYFPTYFEVVATINADKPLGGLGSNSYLIFDYQSPTDFKFAGIDVKINKLQMGHRDETGWHVDVQAPRQLNSDRDYDLLLAINGVTATLVVDGQWTLTHAFAPRVIDDVTVGLNKGLLGIGANNSRARIDNVVVQVLPPEIIFEGTEDFDETPLVPWIDAGSGSWQATGGVYVAAPTDDAAAVSTVSLAFGSHYLVELEARVDAAGFAGLVFDAYGPQDFKFVALSPDTDEVVVGHRTSRGWVTDAIFSRSVSFGEHELSVSLKGRTANLTLDGQAVGAHVFKGLVSDGEVGLFTRDTGSRFDDLTLRTSDTRFDKDLNDDGVIDMADYALFKGDIVARADSGIGSDLNHDGVVDIDDFNLLLPLILEATSLVASTEPSVDHAAGAPLTAEALEPVVDVAVARWKEELDEASAAVLDTLTFRIADLQGLTLGQATGTTVWLDVDGAGHGWFVDTTPERDEEYRSRGGVLTARRSSEAYGAMDLLTAVRHELGHVLGLDHEGEGARVAQSLAPTLDPGVRITSERAAPLQVSLPVDPGVRGEGVKVARSAEIGDGVCLGDRVRVAGKASIGAGSCIGSDSVIGEGSRIGRRVRMGDGVAVEAGAVVPDDSLVLSGSRVGVARLSLSEVRWDGAELRERLRSLLAPRDDRFDDEDDGDRKVGWMRRLH